MSHYAPHYATWITFINNIWRSNIWKKIFKNGPSKLWGIRILLKHNLKNNSGKQKFSNKNPADVFDPGPRRFLKLQLRIIIVHLPPWSHRSSHLRCSEKESLAQVFSCESCEISNNNFFIKHHRKTDSEVIKEIPCTQSFFQLLIINFYQHFYQHFYQLLPFFSVMRA